MPPLPHDIEPAPGRPGQPDPARRPALTDSDAELITAAWVQSGLTWRRFCVQVLGRDENWMRSYREGHGRGVGRGGALPASLRRKLELDLGLRVWGKPGRRATSTTLEPATAAVA